MTNTRPSPGNTLTLVQRLAAASLFASAVATLGAGASPARPLRIGWADAAPVGLRAISEARCGEGMLPDGDACVHLPEPDGEEDRIDVAVSPNAHRERSGRWSIYDQIPRRPDRPKDYDAYRYPIPPGLPGGHAVLSGYDLDLPDPVQRRGRKIHAVGHGGLDLPQQKGTPITLVALEHQQGDADVVYAGSLFGVTVVTRHTLREGGQLRDYLLLYGHLDSLAPGLARGAHLKDGDVLGTVGDTGSPELVHLHLEARRVREGVDVMKKIGAQLLESDVSVVCDPRNVLPLRLPQ
jgi:murein DD-endopeptidase MepM/ murein hydrolase activator NlpD